MRQLRLAATVLALALALASCNTAVPESASPSASAMASNAAPAPSSSPASLPGDSLEPDATEEVLAAALATQAEETLRFATDVRSADPDDSMPAVIGTGQVSFSDPSQFRFASPGVAATMPAWEVIYDGNRALVRGRDAPYLPEHTWLALDILPGTNEQELFVRQYGDYSLVLVAPLGVTSAVAAGEESIGGRAVKRYVTQVDIEAARRHLPDALLAAYDSHVNKFNAAGVPLTHEVEIWVDAEGRIARTRYVQELQGQGIDALAVTYEFDDYGAPMEAEPPAGDEVLTVDEARERYQDSNASPNPS
jgi:hypothetical protein